MKTIKIGMKTTRMITTGRTRTQVSTGGLFTLERPKLSCEWLDEPLLEFGEGGFHVDPKIGISLYGPKSFGSNRHKSEIHVGLIGTGEGIGYATKFFERCVDGIDGDEDHEPFPGCDKDTGYRLNVRMGDELNEKITRSELESLSGIKSQKERFNATLDLLVEKFRILSEREQPINYIVVVMPNDLRSRSGVADYREKGLGDVHRDLRRAFKARIMEYKTPSQIIMESTLSLDLQGRNLDHLTKRAWNIFTGMYFKVEGLPWGPTQQVPGTCHVGISFYRPLGSNSNMRTSLAQAFDENGEGLILRGHPFEWDEEKEGRSPHLTEELAGKLVKLVLDKYKEVRRGTGPSRVVVHKSSRYNPAELRGFKNGLLDVPEWDLIALSPRSDVRLIREGSYPPLRGTSFRAGEITYLYTTGYLPSVGTFQQSHVPSPLQLTDHIGDTDHVKLMGEILALTKMNWNSARMYGSMPITLRFSRLVGDILREFPEDATVDPSPKYKYYM